MVKNPSTDARDRDSIPGSGRSPRNGHPFQYSCLQHPMDRGGRVIAHGLAKSQTQLSEHTILEELFSTSESQFYHLSGGQDLSYLGK